MPRRMIETSEPVVRTTITIRPEDRERVECLVQQARAAGYEASISSVFRAGLHALSAMPDWTMYGFNEANPSIKPGPKKGGRDA